jgi:hypothetical protein
MSVEGERELEEFLAGALSGQPEEETPEPEPEPEPKPEVVVDEPTQPAPTTETEAPPAPPPPKPEEGEAETEAEAEAEAGDEHVVWATKKYGKDSAAWAKAAFHQENHITRLNEEKKQAEDVARQAIEYAQQAEAQAASQVQMSMPLSAAEEQWVEQSMGNPAAAAYQAARAGNVQLYNAVLEQVAMDNPAMAGQIAAQVQHSLSQEMQQLQASSNGQPEAPDFNAELGQSFQRVGVDVKKYGQAMWEKLEELGEYHKYTLAMLGGDQLQRDLAVQAVYDLIRQGETTTRRVVDTEREEQIRREGELRREAASVVTGSPHHEPTQESPFLEAMKQEWQRRGQWTEEE